MKKIFYVLSVLCFFTALSSCKKDKAITPENQIVEMENTDQSFEKRTCGHQEHMAKLLTDPDYERQHLEKFIKLESFGGARNEDCTSPTILPIAVHFQGISNPDLACLRQLAENQVDIINADYQGNNDDISNWDDSAAEYFPGITNGDACVRFCLASQNHPNGYNLNNGDLAVTVNQTTGDFVSAWSGYINIFVRPNLGYLGYSPLGGSGNGDGVVVDAAAFGSGAGCTGVSPEAPYDLGRTLTHELGHYLLLDHVWGNNGGCNEDDGVDDTPVSSEEYYGCPNLGASSCSSNDMHMSYMDYTNDACMYMFSAGQVTRVENYIATSLQNVVDNGSSTCGEVDPPTPTCDDGVQNGDETGVDCGGSCAPCGNGPTCDDGIQNGNETGVDCGGSCAPCETNGGCDIPTNINATVLSSTAAELSWNAVPSATKYRIKYRIQGSAQWITMNTTATTKVLDGLSVATTYQYRIKSICGGERSRWSPIADFTTQDNNGGCNGEALSFALTLDDYGSETTWELLDENGNVISSGGPYGNKSEGDVISDDWCLDDGCYSFVIYDEWGDGICCDYGQGYYEVLDANGAILFESDGQFGFSETTDFCIGGGLMRDIQKSKVQKSSSVRTKPRYRTR